jgi:hypothetical protein
MAIRRAVRVSTKPLATPENDHVPWSCWRFIYGSFSARSRGSPVRMAKNGSAMKRKFRAGLGFIGRSIHEQMPANIQWSRRARLSVRSCRRGVRTHLARWADRT